MAMSSASGASLSTLRPKAIICCDDKQTNSNSNKNKPYLSLSKPKASWIVRTESNVRKQTSKKSDPPCVVCHGTGRLHCSLCHGLGRRNCLHLRMLPQGEWPKWCTTCGGSGLSYCSRCLGTGEYRYIMGFRFMHNDQQTPSS
ncbi:uncharacterized protein LOC126687020 isoform X1 [Mercurialis annua]|uniref:uncharacterized protein LOC126687020 isoform X1 n=1 Tax=Mercurialis annua TaxID=3986 RepID=UPI00215FBC36|nr:uncharacterized protein LOC126687020 isoform X1 [Mercurialis annua]